MASGFVSGGTLDTPVERDDEWLAAQKEIEDLRRKRAEESKQNDGRSLFEILEANKAAKQEAFEESNRLRNQFRSLDESEVEFLDSVLESTRRDEEKVKKETKESLEAFRRQQELADKKLGGDASSADVEQEQWTTGPRKRKRAKEKEILKGVKLRKSSSTNERPAVSDPSTNSASPTDGSHHSPKISPPTSKAPTPIKAVESREANKVQPETKPEATDPKKPAGGGLALVAYGSDDEDD